MFADSLLECAPKTELRRRLTVLLSFGLQLTAMAVALLIPLLRLERLPRMSTAPAIVMSLRRAEATSIAHERSTENLAAPPTVQFVVPKNLPGTRPRQTDASPEMPGPNIGVPWFRGGDGFPLAKWMNSTSPAIHPDLAPVPSRPLHVSHMEPGSLIRRVQPIYPEPAKRAGIQGLVVLKAIIAKDGAIEQLQVVSGHPLLIAGTLQAVRGWRYRPYILNGAAVEVETTITVSFTLNQN